MRSNDARLGMGLGKKLLPDRGNLCRVGHHNCRVARMCRVARPQSVRPSLLRLARVAPRARSAAKQQGLRSKDLPAGARVALE